MAISKQDVLEYISGLSVLELSELVKDFEEKFGVSAAAPVMVAAAGAASSEAEEKTSFNVELKSAWGSKIAVIKVIRELTGLGLKEAKDLADAGWVVKENVSKDDANDMKAKLEAEGATVEVK